MRSITCATRRFSRGLRILTLATAAVAAVAPNVGATSPQVTTKVSVVVDDVFCQPPFSPSGPCPGYGTHLVPNRIPVGPVEFTLLDRRPEATRIGTPTVYLGANGFFIGDGPYATHHLSGDGSSVTVQMSQTGGGMSYQVANEPYPPSVYPQGGFFDVIPTGAPYLTATHVDIVVDSDGNGLATVTPSVAPNGAIEVFVVDHRTNPLDWGPLHVFTGSSHLPIDITAPAGEVCGVTVLCKQTIMASATLSNQTILLRAPSIGGPPEFFDIGFLSTVRPVLASADDPKDVSLKLYGPLFATERENRLLETTGNPYTTYAHLTTGNTNVRFDNHSGQTHTCSIPGYVNPFTLGASSNITKRVALHSGGLTLSAQCTSGASTKTFTLFVY